MKNKLMQLGDIFHDCLTVVELHNPGRKCIYVNSKFEEVTGYSKEEAVGRNLAFLQGPETDPLTIQFMRDRFNEREACIQDIINYRKDGSKFINRLLMLPMRDNNHDLYVGFQNDITHLNLRSSNLDLSKVKSSEICHNVNNHLLILMGHITHILKSSDRISNEKFSEIARRLYKLNQFSLSIENFSEFENFKYLPDDQK